MRKISLASALIVGSVLAGFQNCGPVSKTTVGEASEGKSTSLSSSTLTSADFSGSNVSSRNPSLSQTPTVGSTTGSIEASTPTVGSTTGSIGASTPTVSSTTGSAKASADMPGSSTDSSDQSTNADNQKMICVAFPVDDRGLPTGSYHQTSPLPGQDSLDGSNSVAYCTNFCLRAMINNIHKDNANPRAYRCDFSNPKNPAQNFSFKTTKGHTIKRTATVMNAVLRFNAADYKLMYPDIAQSSVDPLTHYNNFGIKEFRNPNLFFREGFYRAINSDVNASFHAGTSVSGHDHFIKFGQYEKRKIYPVFDEIAYLLKNLDVAKAVLVDKIYSSGIEHYIHRGRSEGRKIPSSTPKILTDF